MLSVFLAASALSALGSGKALWPTPEMYPPASWKAGNQGQTRLRLSPVADGPPRCDIVKSSGDSGLDKAACEIVLPRVTLVTQIYKALKIKVNWYIPPSVQQSDFGGAVPFAPVAWVTPWDIPARDSGSAGGSGETKIAFDVGLDGTASACEVTASSGSSKMDRLFCQLITKRATFLPALDEAGAARVTKATTSIRWWTG